MRRTFLATLLSAALPLAALAQGGPPGAPQGTGPKFDPQRMEKRMKLARTLGLAEALDLDTAAALKLGETMGKFDDRRAPLRKQLRESGELLRRAAQGEKVSAAEVDQAIQKALDARAQIQAINREMVGAVTSGLTPEKKARAVIFLAKFQRRFGGRWMMGPGKGMGGPGWQHGGPGGGHGMGPGGWGMGPDEAGPMMGMMAPPDDFDDE